MFFGFDVLMLCVLYIVLKLWERFMVCLFVLVKYVYDIFFD